jgi:hypothetical protein
MSTSDIPFLLTSKKLSTPRPDFHLKINVNPCRIIIISL